MSAASLLRSLEVRPRKAEVQSVVFPGRSQVSFSDFTPSNEHLAIHPQSFSTRGKQTRNQITQNHLGNDQKCRRRVRGQMGL